MDLGCFWQELLDKIEIFGDIRGLVNYCAPLQELCRYRLIRAYPAEDEGNIGRQEILGIFSQIVEGGVIGNYRKVYRQYAVAVFKELPEFPLQERIGEAPSSRYSAKMLLLLIPALRSPSSRTPSIMRFAGRKTLSAWRMRTRFSDQSFLSMAQRGSTEKMNSAMAAASILCCRQLCSDRLHLIIVGPRR